MENVREQRFTIYIDTNLQTIVEDFGTLAEFNAKVRALQEEGLIPEEHEEEDGLFGASRLTPKQRGRFDALQDEYEGGTIQKLKEQRARTSCTLGEAIDQLYKEHTQ